ncbi:MAG: hypothetical protein IPG50_15805 [Myxococcales bacterium]|nr:hypothetical protein [Myxococcales bacterium]
MHSRPTFAPASLFRDVSWLDLVHGGEDEDAAAAPADTSNEPAGYDASSAEPAESFDAGGGAPGGETPGGEAPGGEAPGGQSSAYSGQNEMESANDTWATPEAGAAGASPTEAPQNEMESANEAWGAQAQPHAAEEPQTPAPAAAAPSASSGETPAAAPIDPEAAIRAMVPTPEVPAPVQFTPEDLRGAGPGTTERERTLARADMALNHEDPASPPRVYQNDIGNCGVIATLNATARTPAGQEYLRGLEGAPQPAPGQGANGDETLRGLEASTGYQEGLNSAQVFDHLGLGARDTSARQAVVDYQRDPSQPTTVTSHAAYDWNDQHSIYGNHVYEVAGHYRHPETGETMVLLRNPHGASISADTPHGQERSLHPRTQHTDGQYYPGVPISQMNRYFGVGTRGRVPR